MRSIVFVILVVLLLAPSAQAALPSCKTQAEQNAMSVRAFQSFLMLAGVACNQADAYNRFMTRYKGQITDHSGALKSYFARVYPRSSDAKMNDFVTDLANAWSGVHLKNMQSYCKASWDIMTLLERLPQVDDARLIRSARAMAAQDGVVQTLCAAPK
jgi:hypothetical protein